MPWKLKYIVISSVLVLICWKLESDIWSYVFLYIYSNIKYTYRSWVLYILYFISIAFIMLAWNPLNFMWFNCHFHPSEVILNTRLERLGGFSGHSPMPHLYLQKFWLQMPSFLHLSLIVNMTLQLIDSIHFIF